MEADAGPDAQLRARIDTFSSNFDNEWQISPRANLVWKIDGSNTAHVGYSRYFTPPPVQNIYQSSVDKYDNTTNAASVPYGNPPKCERSNYYDAGINHQFSPGWTANLDGFVKDSQNMIDEGQFGAAMVQSPFNYRKGYVYGTEASSTYKQGPWSLYGNFAWELTGGEDIDSQQFLIDAAELAYIKDHYIKLDHESEYTASTGVSYNITKNDLVHVDLTYGSGLRSGFANEQKRAAILPRESRLPARVPPGKEAFDHASFRRDQRFRSVLPASKRDGRRRLCPPVRRAHRLLRRADI